jgi:hypothetical protein
MRRSAPSFIKNHVSFSEGKLEAVLKIVDHAQGLGVDSV